MGHNFVAQRKDLHVDSVLGNFKYFFTGVSGTDRLLSIF